ncbi:MAG: damage-control phosphatase ARMT1 family protein [Chloroflexota bacterium]|nr:damage-control phosphatase ARMT1 family protein [Chloroflexota bacterium]
MREPTPTNPPPIRGLEPDSWAHSTISVRFEDIARRVLMENNFPAEKNARLCELIADIPDAHIHPLSDPGAPDIAAWNRYAAPYLGMNWLETPWFFAEHYFYRRIIAAVGYFQPVPRIDNPPVQRIGNPLYPPDPFAHTKQRGLEHGLPTIRALAERLEHWLRFEQPGREILLSLLYLDLWSNQADLSLWPADTDSGDKPDHADLTQAQAYLLADDAPAVVDHLLTLSPNGRENSSLSLWERVRVRARASTGARKLNNYESTRVDFLIDNAGVELVADLAFADYLLTAGVASTVRLHLKEHPTFVSDAVPKDVDTSVTFLQRDDAPSVCSLGERLRAHLVDERLQMRTNFFWTSPLEGWKMPPALADELSESDLVISKGDANYRRLLGDRHWPDITPFADIVAYFPAPLVALRTLKAELICGLRPGQAESVAAEDPNWMVNGRWGVVQFCDYGSSSTL